MNARISQCHLKSRTIVCSLAIALMLMLIWVGGTAAHSGHDHEPASWTARIDEALAGGAVLLLVGGVFWLSNRRSDQSEVSDEPDE